MATVSFIFLPPQAEASAAVDAIPPANGIGQLLKQKIQPAGTIYRKLYKVMKHELKSKQNQEDMEEKELSYEELKNYYYNTVGLWAINRSPQEVSLDWIVENAFQLAMDDTKHSHPENIGEKLKPFDLEAAKAGKPVCTRDGRKARIICFDRKGFCKIVALIKYGNVDMILVYKDDGRINVSSMDSDFDLMMLPEEHEGWVNVYKERCYETKEEAFKKQV